MKIIDRYIGRELLITMALGLGLFTFVLLTEKILDLMDLIITKRVPIGIVARLFLYTLPTLLVTTTPMALLLAVTATYGRLAADQELTALKTAGWSLYRLSLPAFGIGVLAMLFTSFHTIYAVPRGSQAFQDLLFFLTRTRATVGIKERVFNDDFHGLILYANRLDEANGLMEGILVVDNQDEENPRIITARRGRVTSDERQNVVLLKLEQGSYHVTSRGKPGHYRVLGFHALKLALSLSDPTAAGLKGKRPSQMSIPELLAAITERTNKGHPTADLKVSLHQRFAAPAACLVLILLGIPLAIRVRRSGRGISLGLTLLLTMSYYVLAVFGEGMGDKGFIPPFWASWLPNLLLGSLGLFLFIGGNRESWLPRFLLTGWKRSPATPKPMGAP
ncbi:MAG: LPS export ABC transporter permease LptF [Candidatus Methylomirabilales bacterium]|nr:LPS export ABC transporter permease LptF [candidate division NC10 bacterium]MCZ6551934.1 LPS export ABC transporter permease LptF [candidate division NC10 bacterium]